jgi:hypothetical protein
VKSGCEAIWGTAHPSGGSQPSAGRNTIATQKKLLDRGLARYLFLVLLVVKVTLVLRLFPEREQARCLHTEPQASITLTPGSAQSM